MMTPLVSIGIPTYNGAPFLRECLDSILVQTFHDFEVNVIDDYSSDDTVSIAKDYARRDSRIKVHINSARLGLAANFNRCLDLAQGSYICVFGQDDVMLPENIELKLGVLIKNPGVGFVHSNIFMIDNRGSILQEHWEENSKKDYVREGADFARELLLGKNQVCCPSVLMRKVSYQAHGGFLADLYYTCDWEMWMRLAIHHDVACVGAPLIKHRRHAASETHRLAGTRHGIEQEVLAKEKTISSHGHLLSRNRNLRKIVRRAGANKALNCARREYYEDDLTGSRTTLRVAMRLNPSLLTDLSFLNLAVKTVIGRRGLQYARFVKSEWLRLKRQFDV
jgi:glycosyltransferase involved in cell wall biosynthesis